eukprot:TRINITY_DN17476_c0_g1::TRINITY_DN17476_c0_g1_i1::g.28044::m.28044 TRINITY_DN17476_c0_g1::TRINITY_DN17476_c0_g1_i1::g.28044  ORF type:complete len:258 (-),score=21.04,sp/Q9CQQ4/GEMI2_MOUSE/30.92/3e-28,SIP1/PF04938.7/6.6e-47 TRINITY_DN17476_c0_g1_i1:13-759(-)
MEFEDVNGVEWGESDDSEIMPRALPVGDDDDDTSFDASVPPATAEEYLRMVRREAKACPNVVVARNIDPRKFDHKQTAYMKPPPEISKCSPEFLPKPVWVAYFIEDFEELSASLAECMPTTNQAIPSHQDADIWREALYPDASTTPLSPNVSMLMALDQVSVKWLISQHIQWMKEKPMCDEITAQWLFALFARLDRPLDADTASDLRDLLRILAKYRASLSSLEDESLPRLNILISIISVFFGQAETE